MASCIHHFHHLYETSQISDNFFLVKGYQVLSSVEKYDAKTDRWTYIQSLKTRRSGLQLLAADGSLFCLGGFNGSSRQASCERFSFEKQKWKKMADMRVARSNFAAATFDDKILVAGGFQEPFPIKSVEIYHIPTNCWTLVRSHLPHPRSALALAFLPGGVTVPPKPANAEEDGKLLA